MSALIERPSFYEGQILGAADLEAGGAHARGQLARHERYLHLWGIAQGLELTGKDKQTAQGDKYQDVMFSAGIAVDGTGREVVVPEDAALSEDLFDQLNVAIDDPTAWYPVFLAGRDTAATPPVLATSACGSNEPTRTVEGYDIAFGRPGDETLEQSAASAVADGPGGSSSDQQWLVLLGFVQWDKNIKKFTATSLEREGVRPRYAGVRADVVAARQGNLLLRTTGETTAGMPAVLLSEANGGELQFGFQTSSGSVTPLLTVTSKGDVQATGTISGALTTGIYIESGVASDGVLLPLPQDITQDQVDAGKVVLHIHVTPRYYSDVHLAPLPAPAIYFPVPLECTTDGRRVLCRIRWVGTVVPAPPQSQIVDLPGMCDYTLFAVVSATA